MIKVGLWGCGGISSFHRRAYDYLEKQGVGVKLVALCDINKDNFNNEKKINISTENTSALPIIDNCYTNIDEMLENEELDLVDICLPTFLHKDAAIKILERNINVLLEKPMALSGKECDEILRAAEKSSGKLMVGQCVRFMKHYDYLKETVEKEKYGKLVSAEFLRLSAYPSWRKENAGKTDDGAILDFHIHDVDFVQYVFGIPKDIFSVYSKNQSSCDAVTTVFKYDEGFVRIIADWSLPASFPFASPYRVTFEKATLEFNGKDKIFLYEDDKCTELNEIEITQDYILCEIAYYIDIIKNNAENTKNPPQSSAMSVKLAEKIKESAERNRLTVEIVKGK